jgi:hypothetical protein
VSHLGTNTSYFIPSADPWPACVLNAPIGWWYSWRRAQHGKDEALRYFTSFVEDYPVPVIRDVADEVTSLADRKATLRTAVRAIQDWLHHEFGFQTRGRALAEPHTLGPDGFVAAVRAAMPKSRKWSAAEIARLKEEYATTLVPAGSASGDILALERELSNLVNAAYGLTPDEIKLMWQTAPPRMPLDPTEELSRIAG